MRTKAGAGRWLVDAGFQSRAIKASVVYFIRPESSYVNCPAFSMRHAQLVIGPAGSGKST
jgi:capsular polysaccharide biosynthesis protein